MKKTDVEGMTENRRTPQDTLNKHQKVLKTGFIGSLRSFWKVLDFIIIIMNIRKQVEGVYFRPK